MANLIDRLWETHIVRRQSGEPDLLYVDFHLVHEGSSPQAFEGLRQADRPVRRPDLTVATEDHIVSTRDLVFPPRHKTAAMLLGALRDNCEEFGIRLLPMGSKDQGIVHVVGPQLGITQPGMTILCGDSHTSTHGAFGALAFGIGTSQVEHVLATQTIAMAKPRTMGVEFGGELPAGVSAKDMALALIARIGTGGGQGHIIEHFGSAVRSLSMESRMTLCNMSIEAGARAGVIAPDETTFDYIAGRPYAPAGVAWKAAVARWRELADSSEQVYDETVHIDAGSLSPFVTWGTNPSQAAPIGERVPDPDTMDDATERESARRALAYMDLTAGTRLRDISIDTVFLGSCTNGRIEDLRAAAEVLEGRHVFTDLRMVVVPGSMAVKAAAEHEGLDRVFTQAGAEWRSAGCSLCVGMNDDVLESGQRCASTSNRNFEGRQGRGSRTHLVSPAVAAATAVAGRLTTPSDL